jgi:hypothetical protein
MTNTNTIQKFRWFWAWDDEKEEAWLGEMAQQGWHLTAVGLPGFYTFESGEPRWDVYRLDYFTDRKNKAHYLQIFQDAGWDHVGTMNSWQYFRKTAVEGEMPEIYSDNESKAKKYERILAILVALFPIYFISINSLSERAGIAYGILTFVFFAIILLYIYAMLKLIGRVSQLKKKV